MKRLSLFAIIFIVLCGLYWLLEDRKDKQTALVASSNLEGYSQHMAPHQQA